MKLTVHFEMTSICCHDALPWLISFSLGLTRRCSRRTFTKMKTADFNELSESEKRHFYKCRCGEMVDMRQLDDVLFHEDHVERPDIQYGGSVRIDE